MHSSIVRKARIARWCGLAAMGAGFLPVLALVAQSVAATAGRGALRVASESDGWPLLEKLTWIPSQLHALLVVAVIGFGVMMLGAAIARRQLQVLEAAQRHREDGLRRTRQYYDEERIEPYIGPGLPGGAHVIRDEER